MKLFPIAEAVSFDDLLTLDAAEHETKRELKRQRRRLLMPLAIVGGLIALWCAFTPPSDGIVDVRAGQPLVVIGDVHTDAELSLLQEQSRAERIRNARKRNSAAAPVREDHQFSRD